MADMFDNLKNRGSIRRNPPHDKDQQGQRSWVPGNDDTRCTQCKSERASGSVKMSDGTWKKVGSKCRRAMGVSRGTPQENNGPAGAAPITRPHRVGNKRGRPPVVRVDSERMDGK